MFHRCGLSSCLKTSNPTQDIRSICSFNHSYQSTKSRTFEIRINSRCKLKSCLTDSWARAHRCIWTSLFLCVTGSVCSGPWKSQSPPLSWSNLLRLTPLRLPTTTSPRETAVSSGWPGYAVDPCWGPLTRCLFRLTACYGTRRPGGVGQGVVAMPTTVAVAVGAMGSWWGWPVSWAPVRSRTSATVFTSWLDRAGRRTPPPWIRTVLTAMAKHENTPFLEIKQRCLIA